MSVSQTQMEDYARTLLNHDAFDAYREKVHKALFERFRTANPAERDVINSIMDAEDLFVSALKQVVALADEKGDVNDEKDEATD